MDNASSDGSVEIIGRSIEENQWVDWASIVRAPGNHGFAAGNNIVINESLKYDPAFDYFVLLNPDTIVRANAFRLLVDFMSRHPEVGIAGGRSEDPDETPQRCCFRFPTFLSELLLYLKVGFLDSFFINKLSRLPVPEEPCAVDWVSGALMIVRREVFSDIGVMDAEYFLYYEETDFSFRAKRFGWTCWHVPESRIVHLVGQSTGVTQRETKPGRRPDYWFESRRRYFVKNHGPFYAALVDICAIMGFSIWRGRRFFQRKPDLDPPKFLSDLIRHSVLVRGPQLTKSQDSEGAPLN